MTNIQQRLQAIDHPSFFAEVCVKKSATDLPAIVAMIKSQANDNRPLVAEIIGEELLEDILKLEL